MFKGFFIGVKGFLPGADCIIAWFAFLFFVFQMSLQVPVNVKKVEN